MNAAKLKLQAVLVAWHSLKLAVEDVGTLTVENPGVVADLETAADKLRDRLEELEGLIGCETPANLFDLPATR
jgi:hypothetical protein